MITSTGRVFGATSQGGANNNGTLYEYNPTNNTLTKRRDFTTADGRFALAALVEADNGRLYGLAGAVARTHKERCLNLISLPTPLPRRLILTEPMALYPIPVSSRQVMANCMD